MDEIRQLLAPEFHILRALSEGGASVRASAELHPDAVVSDAGALIDITERRHKGQV
jgi:hypothetical protein